MGRTARAGGYLLVALVLMGLMVFSPTVWATPEQSRYGQTVPTMTPATQPSQPEEPDDSTDPTDPAQPQPAPTTAPAPALTPGAASTPALALTLGVSRLQAVAGASLTYTVTLVNEGVTPAQQVVIEDPLPEHLEPGQILSGPAAAWDGRTLRAQAPVLDPGQQLTVVFTASVAKDVANGAVLVNRATARAAGGLEAFAAVAVALPPSELPPTGSNLAEVGQ